MQTNRHHDLTAHRTNPGSKRLACHRYLSTRLQQDDPGTGPYPASPLKPELDVETTWLTYRDSEVEFDHGSNIHRVPLIPGLIEYFTGHLQWIDNDVVALHPPLDTPSPTPDTQQPDVKPPAIQPLGRAATVTFFTEVSEQLEQCYTQNLADYWSTATLDGETRSSRFVAEQIECLTSECAVLIALGKMTTGHYSLLSAALGPCATNATEGFEDLQPHSVYSLSARDGDGPSLSLYGAFAIARRLRDAPVQPDPKSWKMSCCLRPMTGWKHLPHCNS